MPLACSEESPVIPATGRVSIHDLVDCAGDQALGGNKIDGFREGPGLVEVATPVMVFLRRWLPRPLSLWHQELILESWPLWQANLLTRTVTFLWFLAGGIAISLIAIGAVALLWEFIGI